MAIENSLDDHQYPSHHQQILSSCLALMKAPSNEQIFAGLLMMAKHLSTIQPASSSQDMLGDVRRQILEAVKPEFLGRLLYTPTASQGIQGESSQEGSSSSSGNSFQAVALVIMACLVQDPRLVPQLRPLLRSTLTVLDQTKDERMIEDCLFYIYSLASYDPASVEALIKNKAFARVASCLVRIREHVSIASSLLSAAKQEGEGGGNQGQSEGQQQEKEREGGKDQGQNEEQQQEKKEATTMMPSLIQQACAALQHLASLEEKTGNWICDSEGLTLLAQILEQDRTDLKLAILHVLATLLAQRRGRDGWDDQGLTASFGSNMRSALVQLLHGGLKEAHRDHAMSLLVHMLGIFGQGWVIDEEDDEIINGKSDGSIPPGGKEHNAGMIRGASASFFVHVLSAEARMSAEELEALWGAEAEVAADPSLHTRIDRARRILPLCVDGLDTVLRFLCGAGDGEHVLDSQRSWAEDLPGPILLKMRLSIQEIVGALMRIFKDAASELKRGDTGCVCDTFKEAVNLLSAVMAEDQEMIPSSDAILALPTAMHLVLGSHLYNTATTTATEGSSKRVHLLYPWISLILSKEEDDIMPVMTLLDHQIHHLLIDQLATNHPLPHHTDFLLLLHELLERGGDKVACDEHDCLLSNHPLVLALLPHLARAATYATGQGGLTYQYIVWFAMFIMSQREESEVQSVLPLKGREMQMLMDTLGQILNDGVDLRRSAGAQSRRRKEEGEEEKEEGLMLWRRIVALTKGSPSSVRMKLLMRLEKMYGRLRAEALDKLLLQQQIGR